MDSSSRRSNFTMMKTGYFKLESLKLRVVTMFCVDTTLGCLSKKGSKNCFSFMFLHTTYNCFHVNHLLYVLGDSFIKTCINMTTPWSEVIGTCFWHAMFEMDCWHHSSIWFTLTPENNMVISVNLNDMDDDRNVN